MLSIYHFFPPMLVVLWYQGENIEKCHQGKMHKQTPPFCFSILNWILLFTPFSKSGKRASRGENGKKMKDWGIHAFYRSILHAFYSYICKDQKCFTFYFVCPISLIAYIFPPNIFVTSHTIHQFAIFQNIQHIHFEKHLS